MELAEMLVDALPGVQDEAMHDEYAAALEPVVDLLAALRESVRAARTERG